MQVVQTQEFTYTPFEKLERDKKGFIISLPIDGIIWGDVFEVLKATPSNSLDWICYSPPYFNLRSYSPNAKQFGHERTMEDYLGKLKIIMTEVFRILKPTGVCFVNLGDTYNGDKSGNTSGRADQKSTIGREKKGVNVGPAELKKVRDKRLPKGCLMNIPLRFVLMCTDEIGFCEPNELLWVANNKKPNSSPRRWSNNVEKVFFLVKDQSKYYFDTQYEEISESMMKEITQKYTGQSKKDYEAHGAEDASNLKRKIIEAYASGKKVGRIARQILDYNVHGYHGMHVAVFPLALIEHLVNAGCPRHICNKCGALGKSIYAEKRINTRPGRNTLRPGFKSGTAIDPDAKFHKSDLSKYRQKIIRTPIGVEMPCKCDAGTHPGLGMDIFFGSGTSGLALKLNGCNFVGIEIMEEYCKEAAKRITEELPKILAERAKEAKKRADKEKQMTLQESIQKVLN